MVKQLPPPRQSIPPMEENTIQNKKTILGLSGLVVSTILFGGIILHTEYENRPKTLIQKSPPTFSSTVTRDFVCESNSVPFKRWHNAKVFILGRNGSKVKLGVLEPGDSIPEQIIINQSDGEKCHFIG